MVHIVFTGFRSRFIVVLTATVISVGPVVRSHSVVVLSWD